MTMRDNELETEDLAERDGRGDGEVTSATGSADVERSERGTETDAYDARSNDKRSNDVESNDVESSDEIGELFAPEDRESFDARWSDVQVNFVDDPRGAVAAADRLVADVMESLSRRFDEHKASLAQQWSGPDEVATEELRLAVQQYRAFFHRLLGA